jgi:hypothetical protein
MPRKHITIKTLALRADRDLLPRNTLGYSFLLESGSTLAQSAAGKIWSVEPNGLIWIKARDLRTLTQHLYYLYYRMPRNK